MDIICFSHLRWDFVYQRPQHIVSRLANVYRVFYVEEPFYNSRQNNYTVTSISENVTVIKIFLSGNEGDENILDSHREMMNTIVDKMQLNQQIFWYYTPMALLYSRHLNPELIVYDCMDELSAFRFAPTNLKELEAELFRLADVVFTGGNNLYETKKGMHENIYAFPSSIDKAHFEIAREGRREPSDQSVMPHPKLGFYGVIDERFDISLIEKIADRRPDWNFIYIGPVCKIDERSLPRRPNIHFLGPKQYNDLPLYLSGWDVAMLCFALNDSTEFISPTKTPEYLAAGKPVVSTPVKEVVKEYGHRQLVHIASDADAFVKACERALLQVNDSEWLARVDAYLADKSWDQTVTAMQSIIQDALLSKSVLKTNYKEENKRYV